MKAEHNPEPARVNAGKTNMKHSFDNIQQIAGIFANFRDCMPDGYTCSLYISSTGHAEIWIYNTKTEKIVFVNTWEAEDTIKSFEDRLETFVRQLDKN